MHYAFKNKHNAAFCLPKFCIQIVLSEVKHLFRRLDDVVRMYFLGYLFLTKPGLTDHLLLTSFIRVHLVPHFCMKTPQE